MEKDPDHNHQEQEPLQRRDWRVEDGSLWRSPYVATLLYEVPNDPNWALHPTSARFINEKFSGRCPLTVRRRIGKHEPAQLSVDFLIEDDSQDMLAELEIAGQDIATLLGLPNDALVRFEITNEDETNSEQTKPHLQVVPPLDEQK